MITLNQTSNPNYLPDQACFDWCLLERVVYHNNIELYSVLLVGLAYVMLVLASVCEEYPKLHDYRYTFVYMSKLMLLLFFGYYFIVVRWGMI